MGQRAEGRISKERLKYLASCRTKNAVSELGFLGKKAAEEMVESCREKLYQMASTAIQALWRGYAIRRGVSSASASGDVGSGLKRSTRRPNQAIHSAMLSELKGTDFFSKQAALTPPTPQVKGSGSAREAPDNMAPGTGTGMGGGMRTGNVDMGMGGGVGVGSREGGGFGMGGSGLGNSMSGSGIARGDAAGGAVGAGGNGGKGSDLASEGQVLNGIGGGATLNARSAAAAAELELQLDEINRQMSGLTSSLSTIEVTCRD